MKKLVAVAIAVVLMTPGGAAAPGDAEDKRDGKADSVQLESCRVTLGALQATAEGAERARHAKGFQLDGAKDEVFSATKAPVVTVQLLPTEDGRGFQLAARSDDLLTLNSIEFDCDNQVEFTKAAIPAVIGEEDDESPGLKIITVGAATAAAKCTCRLKTDEKVLVSVPVEITMEP